jgi:glycosyltransferase involved in cell wall biosynthesis
VLFREKNFREIASFLAVLSEDRGLRRAILETQTPRVRDFAVQKLAAELMGVLGGLELIESKRALWVEPETEDKRRWQIEGPFETSYSLALVNRETASALEKRLPGQVALFPTEGPGDYVPDPENLKRLPALEPLWRRGKKGALPDVVLRNLYPPRVEDADGRINLLSFAWEESNLPAAWVERFNQSLDGVVVPSSFVKKVLQDAGVFVPIFVVGHGAEHVLGSKTARVARSLGKGFRFLHVSSAFPRKGVDVLLEAFGKAFSSNDDVTLVLKTFPNIHNDVEKQLASIRGRQRNYPDVVWINEELSAGELRGLYENCHAFVAPSRGEGFGLPMAEAMLHELPVITTAWGATAWGGQRDFCTPETAWLVEYSFAPAQTHLGVPSSVWAEPDVGHLAACLKEVHGATGAKLRTRVERAKRMTEQQLRWSACAERITEAVEVIQGRAVPSIKRRKLGWVSSWNAKCGIAMYSRYLLEGFEPSDWDVTVLASRKDARIQSDEENVSRCWDDAGGRDANALIEAVLSRGLDAVVFQFNFGFFKPRVLGEALRALRSRGVKTLVTFHATKDVDRPDFKASLSELREDLAKVDRLLVHGVDDLNRLKNLGLAHNTVLFPQGVLSVLPIPPAAAREKLGIRREDRIIATYGFLLPHKGTEELIRALQLLRTAVPSAKLLLVNALYPIPESEQLRDRCRALAKSLGVESAVTAVHDYLPEAKSNELLACADIVIFPYQATAESSSAAVRVGLCSGRPVACTPLQIFSDVQSVVHTLPGTDAERLAKGLQSLLEDPTLLASKLSAQEKWVQEHAWPKLSRRLTGLLQAVMEA